MTLLLKESELSSKMITSFFGGGSITTMEEAEDDDDEEDEDDDDEDDSGGGGLATIIGEWVTTFFLRQQHHQSSNISASNANAPTIHPMMIFLSRIAKYTFDTVQSKRKGFGISFLWYKNSYYVLLFKLKIGHSSDSSGHKSLIVYLL